MLHLGDITKINGHTAPIVDCIIGGSPCQDLSVAGKRAGLDGERSGLYMEQIRLVKEMRLEDEKRGRTGVDIRPRYMVWENVPGAFSSNKGEDFRIVLEEIAKVCDQDAVIPMPDKGKWTSCGCIVGDGWSIAWRVLDAQFWGVPQRRRRIALVADFGGQSAPEILLVRKSLSGYSDESKPKRKAVASDASRGIGADDSLGADQYNGVILGDTVSTLGVNCGMSHGRQCVLEPVTLKIRSGCEGGGKGALVQTDKSATLACNNDQYLFQPVYSVENHPNDSRVGINEDGMVQALTGRMGTGDVRTTEAVVYALDRASYNQGKNAQFDFEISAKGINSPLVAKGPGAVCYSTNHGSFHTIAEEGLCATLQATDYKDPPTATYRVGTRYIVRRLTPLECERLQGYPNGWTDIGEWTDSNGKKHKTSDASRYKALGNSIALPPWKWVLKRLCACYERDATMASLFDGIGGFPYLWEQLNGKGTCLWASEIEEFPMAVTKVRIGGDT